MNGTRIVRLVAVREFRERLRSWAFIASTALVLVFVVGGAVLTSVADDVFDTRDSRTLGLLDVPPSTQELLPGSGAPFGFDLHLQHFEDTDAAHTALADGDIDALLTGNEDLEFQDTQDDELAGVVAQAIRISSARADMEAAGLPEDTIASILGPGTLTISINESDDDDGAAFAVAFGTAIVMFTAILTYGQWVLAGVVGEKANRVVEVLLATLRPSQLLTGKIVGTLALGLCQLLLTGLALGATLALLQGVSLPAVSAASLLGMGLWFLLGLLFYSMIYAAAGATVSRQEDAGTVSGPITMILSAAYFASVFFVLRDAGGMAARILSFIPPSAPVVVPVRLALGEIPWWELTASIVVMLLATLAAIWLSARLYAAAVLQMGPRLGLRGAWHTLRNSRRQP